MSQTVDIMAAAFQDELEKIASVSQQKLADLASAAKSRIGRLAIPALAGAALYEGARRANQDRKMGRAMRVQQSY